MKWRISIFISSIIMEICHLDGINAQQDVLFHQGCDAGSEPCNLLCFFKTTAENFNVTWTYNGEPVDNSHVRNSHINSGYKSKLRINNEVESEGNYTCTGYDEHTDQLMIHNFPINGNQSIPKILNSSYEIMGEGSCNVTFTCVIKGVPSPIVDWLKIDLKAGNSSIVSGYDNFTTEITNSSNYYNASLTITNYSNTDVANYTCVAYNEIGIAVSNMIFPHVSPGYPVISEQAVSFKPGDVVHLNCTSIGGFPAPNISWTFKGQNAQISQHFDLIDNGVSVAYLDITTNWNSDDVRVCCVVQDTTGLTEDMKSGEVQLHLTTIPYLVDSKNCSVDEFNNYGRCSFACEVYSPSYVSVQWLYRFDGNQDAFPITNISYPPRPFFRGPYRVTLDLTAKEYRTGLYECKFESSPGNISNTFHIIGTKQTGDYLGARCTDNSANNCGTWNSECISSVCRCPPEYPIESEDYQSQSSACLPVAPPDSLCLNSHQCTAYKSNFQCYRQFSYQRYGFCECRRPYYNVYIHETDSYQCILKASYQYSCVYDAQCQLSDPFLECDDDDYTCECVNGYYYSSSHNYCQYETDSADSGLSATAAIIVTISIFIVIVFVVTLIFIRTNSMNVQRRNRARARRAASNSNSPLRPYTVPDNWSEGQTILPPYTATDIAPPPSYHEAQRCETPPPPFDSIVGIKPEDEVEEPRPAADPVQDADSQQSSPNGIFHIFGYDSATTGFLNPAYEDDC